MAAVVLGVVTLGLGAGSVVLDQLTHQRGTGGPVADAFVTAAGVMPATAVGMLLAARRPFQPAHVSVWLPGPELSSRPVAEGIGHDE